MTSQSYDFVQRGSGDAANGKQSGMSPASPRAAAQPGDEDSGVSAGGLLAGSVLSAALGIFLARRRQRKRTPATPAELHAKQAADVVKSRPKSGEHKAKDKTMRYRPLAREHGVPRGLERAIRLTTLLLPLVAAYRRAAVKASQKKAEAAVLPKPAEPGTSVSNIHANQKPAPTDYLDPAAEVQMLKGGTRLQQAGQLTSAAINAWLADFAPSMGAAIAYYTIFSIAPMLVIAIAVAGMIFGHDAAQGEIVNQIRDVVGTEGAYAIQGLLKSASEPREGLIAAALSVVTLAIGATAVFAELQSALDRIWRVPVVKRKSGLWLLLRSRLLSFGLILGLGFLLIISLVVSAGLAALGRWWGGWFDGWQVVLQALNFVISFVVFSSLFSVIYKFMPRVKLSWRDVWIGAVATTVLFIIGKYLIGLYLGRAGMTSGFGAAGSFALLLVWIYYSAQIFLLGAEFTWIYANNYGSRAMRQRLAGAVADDKEVVVQEKKAAGSG